MIAPNISPDPETGIGNWTDDEIARAIQEGVNKDGRALFPVMPYMRFRNFTDEDLASVVVYLRSIPPVKNAMRLTKLNFPLNFIVKTIPAAADDARASARADDGRSARRVSRRDDHRLRRLSHADEPGRSPARHGVRWRRDVRRSVTAADDLLREHHAGRRRASRTTTRRCSSRRCAPARFPAASSATSCRSRPSRT